MRPFEVGQVFVLDEGHAVNSLLVNEDGSA